jgi:hypothetical protein
MYIEMPMKQDEKCGRPKVERQLHVTHIKSKRVDVVILTILHL